MTLLQEANQAYQSQLICTPGHGQLPDQKLTVHGGGSARGAGSAPAAPQSHQPGAANGEALASRKAEHYFKWRIGG